MRAPRDIATDYLAVWNEASATVRRRLLETWHPDARYRDPLMAADGREAVAAMIESARERFPDLAFRLHGTPDGHGPFVRFSWTLGPADGPSVAAGTDVVRLDATGRIAEVIGFLDEVRS
ncbi:nuclear transport factor 2 family protein [Methylobacterium indicum]|uniref:nuclear transport factor 2 family protein n=1 Tax=Methylobacterium indicum TaxID=1775910 RepID=UPI002434A62A|nr:nuclear transport factor 2 family protein [Methylobacterium indicum]